jgi:hypothetical protein
MCDSKVTILCPYILIGMTTDTTQKFYYYYPFPLEGFILEIGQEKTPMTVELSLLIRTSVVFKEALESDPKATSLPLDPLYSMAVVRASLWLADQIMQGLVDEARKADYPHVMWLDMIRFAFQYEMKTLTFLKERVIPTSQSPLLELIQTFTSPVSQHLLIVTDRDRSRDVGASNLREMCQSHLQQRKGEMIEYLIKELKIDSASFHAELLRLCSCDPREEDWFINWQYITELSGDRRPWSHIFDQEKKRPLPRKGVTLQEFMQNTYQERQKIPERWHMVTCFFHRVTGNGEAMVRKGFNLS